MLAFMQAWIVKENKACLNKREKRDGEFWKSLQKIQTNDLILTGEVAEK